VSAATGDVTTGRGVTVGSPAGLWAHQGWWIRRLAMLPVHLVVFAVIVFFLVRLVPGDPVAVLSGGQTMTPEQYEAARASLGLTSSLPVQLGTFLARTAALDLGSSVISGTPVLPEMLTRVPETVELAVLAMAVSALLTLVLGFLVVLRPRTLLARVVASYSRAAGAVPDFCLGVAGIFVFYSVLHWAPAPIGRYDPLLNPPPHATGFPLLDALLSSDAVLTTSMLAHLWLPVGVLVAAYAPMLVKLFVRALQQALDAQATTFRIASGAPRRTVLLSITRRALPATVAMSGTIFGFMVGGAVVVEQLFALPGMGQYAVTAVTRSDFVALRGFLLTVGFLSLLVFFLVDVVTMALDPRRRSGAAVTGG
jgi:ABC-type dipeptide/oligopeptide/nickel transport system permease component